MVISYDLIIVVLIFIVLDFVSGIILAVKNKNMNSTKMREGLFHKLGFILTIILGIAIEYAMNYMELGFTIPIVTSICIFLVITEIVSILENLIGINPALNNHAFLKIFGRKNDGSGESHA